MKFDSTQLGVAPVHLKGADRIAKYIGVTRHTIIDWHRQGGPVARVGRVYMAEYNALMAWLAARNNGTS